MARIKFGGSSSSVIISDDLSGYVRAAVRRAGGDIADTLEQAADTLAEDARKAWPVGRDRKTQAHSGEGFSTELRVSSDGTIRAVILNTVPHTFFVKSKQVSGGGRKKHAWGELVRKPGAKEGERIAAELGPALAKMMGGK